MTDTVEIETYASEVIKFAPSTALLGLETNGAAPQRIYGFHVEADIADHHGEAAQSYWLKATVGPASERGKDEYVMFAASADVIETVLGAVISASVTPGYDKVLEGEFDGYANSAQNAFDSNMTEECIENLKCRISSSPLGFSLKLSDGEEVITSMMAKLSSQGIDKTIALVEGLREWSGKHVAAIEDRNKAAAPSM